MEACDAGGTCGSAAGLPEGATIQTRVTSGCFSCSQCADEVDNDGDGLTDYPDDPDCASEDDNDEGPGCEHCNTLITIRYTKREQFLGQVPAELRS